MKKSKKIFLSGVVVIILGIAGLSFSYAIKDVNYFKYNYVVSTNPNNDSASMVFAAKNVKTVVGDNKIVTKTQKLPDISSMELGGNFDLTINPDNSNALTISADDNVLPYLNSSVSNNIYKLGVEPNVNLALKKPIAVVFNTQNLNSLALGGSVNLNANNLNAKQFNLLAAGNNHAVISGNIQVLVLNLRGKAAVNATVLNNDTLEISSMGNNELTLSGKTQNLKIIAQGKIIVNAKNLVAQNIKIIGQGKQVLVVNAEKNLVLETMGDAEVTLYGNPAITKTVLGQIRLVKGKD